MYFTNGSSRAFESRSKTASFLILLVLHITLIPVTFTVRIGSTSSVCTRNVRMSRAS